MTQYDLRGFVHPAFGRMKYMGSAKSLDATTANFAAFAAGCGRDQGPTDESYVSDSGSSFEDYLAMCKKLAKDCEGSEKEAIQLIVQEIVKQSEEMKAEVVAGKRGPSAYLKPLEKDNRWGKVVLALAEAFEVKLEQPVA